MGFIESVQNPLLTFFDIGVRPSLIALIKNAIIMTAVGTNTGPRRPRRQRALASTRR